MAVAQAEAVDASIEAAAPAPEVVRFEALIKQIVPQQRKELDAEDPEDTPEDEAVNPVPVVVIEGHASTPTLDRYREVVDPAAFKQGVADFEKKNPIVLFAHNHERPIGKVVSLSIDKGGLTVRCEIFDVEIGTMIRAGVLRTFSIGFIIKNWTYDEKSEVRTITALDLVEISVVSVPANPDATFDLAKALKSFFKTHKQAPTPAVAARSADAALTEPQDGAEVEPIPTTPTMEQPDATQEAEAPEAQEPTVETPVEPTAEASETEETVAAEAATPDNAVPATVDATADDNAEAPAEVAAVETNSEEAAPVAEAAAPSHVEQLSAVHKALLGETQEEEAPTEEVPVAPVVAPLTEELKALRSEHEATMDALVPVLTTLAARLAQVETALSKLPARKAMVATPAKFTDEEPQQERKSLRQTLLEMRRAA